LSRASLCDVTVCPRPTAHGVELTRARKHDRYDFVLARNQPGFEESRRWRDSRWPLLLDAAINNSQGMAGVIGLSQAWPMRFTERRQLSSGNCIMLTLSQKEPVRKSARGLGSKSSGKKHCTAGRGNDKNSSHLLEVLMSRQLNPCEESQPDGRGWRTGVSRKTIARIGSEDGYRRDIRRKLETPSAENRTR
ncbi:hypothetical protein CORC01_06086, partial [Colletotrichum orchidophilum]